MNLKSPMKSKFQIKGILNYFKKKKNVNLLIGGLLFISGIIACAPGIIHLYNSIIQVGLSIFTVDTLMADLAYSALLILPSFALFSIAYMLWEAHSLGWKLSTATCGLTLFLAATRYINIEFALAIGALSGLAAIMENQNRRKAKNKLKDSPVITENLAKFGLRLSAIICMTILVGMIVYITARGSLYISLSFFSNTHWSWVQAFEVFSGRSKTMGGVLSQAIGTLLVVAVCEFVAIPLGLGAAIYLSEYTSQNKLTSVIRFFIETLAGIPSIVLGVVGAALFVIQLQMGLGLWACGLSLAFMILPWNIRIAEEAMKSVQRSYREAAFALGATQWQTVRNVVLFAALPGIITGILLGVGAAMGETMVMFYTAGPSAVGLPSLSKLLSLHTGEIPNLTTFIWLAPQYLNLNPAVYGQASNFPFDSYAVSYAAAFVLIVIYLAICIVALYARNYLNKKITGK